MTERVSWGTQAYAGFWRRFAGILIDGFILSTVSGLLAGVFAPPVLLDPLDPQTLQVRPGYFSAVAGWSLVGGVIWVAYEAAMLSTLGWTLGKRVVGVEVRGADDALLSVPRAIGRSVGKYVSALPLYLGFLWAAWDPRKQAWHDKFVSSYVLRRSALEPAAGEPAPVLPGRAAEIPPQPSRQGTWGIQPRPSAAAPDPAAPGAPPDAAAAGRDVGTPAGPEPGSRTTGSGAAPAEPDPGEQAAPPAAPAAEPSILDEIDFGVPDKPQAPETGEPARRAEAARPEPPSTTAPPPGGVPSATTDPNLVAVAEADISDESAAWLRQVAGQVDARLDRISSDWRSTPQPDAARACAFGLLMGHLARLYPHMQGDLSRVAEAHPSFSTLTAGGRLQTLQELAGDQARGGAWLGPLIGTDDPGQMRLLFE